FAPFESYTLSLHDALPILDSIPEPTIASFAGTGNPFGAGQILPGERVVDVGCGGGIDSFIAAKMVGPEGRLIGVDMTAAMVAKADRKSKRLNSSHVAISYA